MNKKILVVGLLLTILIIIGFVAWLSRNKSKPNNQTNQQKTSAQTVAANKSESPPSQTTTTKTVSNLSKQWSQGKCKGQGPVEFKNSPMNLDDVAVILPYGLLADAHVTPIDHMYFSPAQFDSPRDKYPVYAIADGTIVNISHRGSFVGDQQADRKTDEYRLDVEYTCTFYSYYDLITSLAPEIIAKLSKHDSGHWSEHIRIPIKAGQEIGRIGGQTLDWAVYNTEIILPGFLVPEHYDREAWKIHTDYNAFEYFPETLKQSLYAKLARTVKPRLGKIDYDIDGKAVGNWFKQGTNGYEGINKERYWDGHLAIVLDYIDPTQWRFSIGNYNGNAKQFGIKDNDPDPTKITTESGEVKYELMTYDYFNQDTGINWRSNEGPISNPASRNVQAVQGTALIQMIETRKLKVEVFPGKTAGEVNGFTSGVLIYER